MEVIQVLRMNEGVGDTSYASNSLLQKKVISMTKPITEEAITKLYSSLLPTKLVMADLGCSSGPNALLVASEFITIVNKICTNLGSKSPEFQVFLNDLPGNDFNTIFRSLPNFQESIKKQKESGAVPCVFAAVPGSFYGRLFPSKSVHFFHSSYSLHWLSKVPEGIESINKGNIYIASTSPPSVLQAYYQQFQSDCSLFLKCRSEEMVTGGRMALTFLGRKNEDPSSEECYYIWELMAKALNDMVSEGLIEEEKLNSFNIPLYYPSPAEIKLEVVNEGSFAIDQLKISEVNWNTCTDDAYKDRGFTIVKCMRAVAEPLLVSQFGEAIINEMFRRYAIIIADRTSKEKAKFFNITVSLIKIG